MILQYIFPVVKGLKESKQ